VATWNYTFFTRLGPFRHSAFFSKVEISTVVMAGQTLEDLTTRRSPSDAIPTGHSGQSVLTRRSHWPMSCRNRRAGYLAVPNCAQSPEAVNSGTYAGDPLTVQILQTSQV
jgi:hypothetical protein